MRNSIVMRCKLTLNKKGQEGKQISDSSGDPCPLYAPTAGAKHFWDFTIQLFLSWGSIVLPVFYLKMIIYDNFNCDVIILFLSIILMPNI